MASSYPGSAPPPSGRRDLPPRAGRRRAPFRRRSGHGEGAGRSPRRRRTPPPHPRAHPRTRRPADTGRSGPVPSVVASLPPLSGAVATPEVPVHHRVLQLTLTQSPTAYGVTHWSSRLLAADAAPGGARAGRRCGAGAPRWSRGGRRRSAKAFDRRRRCRACPGRQNREAPGSAGAVPPSDTSDGGPSAAEARPGSAPDDPFALPLRLAIVAGGGVAVGMPAAEKPATETEAS